MANEMLGALVLVNTEIWADPLNNPLLLQKELRVLLKPTCPNSLS